MAETQRRIAVLVGALFLTSTATFAVGSSLIASEAGSRLTAGVLLEVYTGLAVVGIGVAMLPLLSRYSARGASAYLGFRILECAAIVSLGAYMVATARELADYELVIYSLAGLGGIVFSYLLSISELIPRALSLLGMFGYAVLLAGVASALAGLASLDSGWGTAFFVPGGLFELILPLLLFVKGFSAGAAPSRSARPTRPRRRLRARERELAVK